MKKFWGILLIVMSIALVGCSNSNDSDQSSNEKSSSKSSEKKRMWRLNIQKRTNIKN